MNLRNNIQAKIQLFIISTVIFIFVLIGVFVGVRNSRLAVENAYEYTELMAHKNSNEVNSIFERYIGLVKAGASIYQIKLENEQELNVNEFSNVLSSQIKDISEVESLFLYLHDDENTSISGWYNIKNGNNVVDYLPFGSEAETLASNYIGSSVIRTSEPYMKGDVNYINITAPIHYNTKVIGYYGLEVNLSFFDEFIQTSYIYEGGFITVMSHQSVFVAHSIKSLLGKKFAENFPEDEANFKVEKQVLKGSEFNILTNFEKQSYYSYFVPTKVDESDNMWCVEVTVPMHKILEVSKKSIRKSVLVAILGVILMIVVISFSTRRIISPVKRVTKILNLLAIGDTKNINTLNIKTGDELQEMSDSLDKLVAGLKKTEQFALEIGDGNLDNEYTLLGDEDQLGKALLTMRQNLHNNKEQQEQRKKEESIRNWGTEGIAKFAEILRRDNNDMKKLSFNVVSNLINYLKVNQGALFVLNEEDEDNKYYELSTAIAYNRDKFMKKEIAVGEGLVGRCAYEKKTIYLKEVPESYVNITSGLGTANPNCILIVPCLLNDLVYAVIEIASFKELESYEIEFVEKLGESIGATISSVRINEKTTKLLRASQQQGEELAAQEEEMRQNLEEMQATQEELQRQNNAAEEMKKSLSQQSALLNALLDNIPDYIYFKDLQSKFLRISKSMLHLFNANSVDEVIGKSDYDFKPREEAEKYYNDEQEIIQTGKQVKNQLQKEVTLDGKEQWNSVTKMPLMNEDNTCMGTFGISKDVTEIKELEIESIKKQAELEGILESISNSTYMVQYDTSGLIIDVNTAVLELFDISRDDIVGTFHKDGFDFKGRSEEEYQEFWNSIITGEIKKETNKVVVNKKQVWLSETYNPIRNEKGEIYKIMKLAFDVTEFVK